MTDPLDRRSFLRLAGAGLVTVGLAGCSGDDGGGDDDGAAAPPEPVDLPGDGPLFPLGVASGDPLPDRVVLWTRLARRPRQPGGGLPEAPVPVEWEIARDERFADVAARGTHTAEPRWAHSVHVDAGGLEPDTWYWYRFRAAGEESPVGRARTAPAAGATPRSGRLRLAFAACQNLAQGRYGAYPHLVADEPDAVLWLGDYIYEHAGGGHGDRRHPDTTAVSLDDYRLRYAIYNGDPQLQAARAAQPWIVIWDDHEVANNYGGDEDASGSSPDAVRARKAAAYQAWWEHQPVRTAPPSGSSLTIHRTLDWGGLARLFALDGRQHRSGRACAGSTGLVDDCPDRTDPGRSILGQDQRDWLLGELAGSRARWNLLGNDVVMTPVPLGGRYNLDQWDGFAADQRRLLDAFAARPDANPVVLTGDIHAFAATDLRADPGDPSAPVVATELVGGAISSAFLFPPEAVDAATALPDVHLLDGSLHGYGLLEVTAEEARCRFRAVSTVVEPEATVDTLAEVVVAAGRPGARLL